MSVIITGDNMWTGLCIAEECGIVNTEKMTIFSGDVDRATNQLVWELNPCVEDEAKLDLLSKDLGEANIWAEGEFDLEEAVKRMSLRARASVLFELKDGKKRFEKLCCGLCRFYCVSFLFAMRRAFRSSVYYV